MQNSDGISELILLNPPPQDEQAEAKAQARPILEERLNEQIDEFIAFLRSQRIIPR